MFVSYLGLLLLHRSLTTFLINFGRFDSSGDKALRYYLRAIPARWAPDRNAKNNFHGAFSFEELRTSGAARSTWPTTPGPASAGCPIKQCAAGSLPFLMRDNPRHLRKVLSRRTSGDPAF
jgi:hypothetical protein